MNKKEFLDYVSGFHKKPGEYTQAELYEIGLKHKELDISERNWNELVSLLEVKNEKGEPKTGETFRCWIKAQQLSDGSLPKNIKMLSGRTVEDITTDEAEQNLEEQKRELYKQETRTRDVYRAYRESLRSEARVERAVDAIKETANALGDFKPINFVGNKSAEQAEAVVLFSDLHLGAYVDNFFNKYNIEVAKQRVALLTNKIIDTCRREQITRLNFVNLGDLIAGCIHVNARIEQEIDVIEQIMTAAEMVAEVLNELQKAAPEIIYRSCTDNHSRAIADLKQHLEAENFGRLIDFYLKERLKNTRIVFADDNLDDDIGYFELLNGENMVFAHGHRENVNTCVQNFTACTKKYINYVALGHFHTSKMKTFQGSKVFINGSIIGPDTYAQSKRLYGEPEQTMLVWRGKDITTHYFNLNVN